MDHDSYYKESRGYNWHDMMEMRTSRSGLGRSSSEEVPDVFKHRFADRAAYDAWVAQKRKLYFG
jgi:hypothetical protein